MKQHQPREAGASYGSDYNPSCLVVAESKPDIWSYATGGNKKKKQDDLPADVASVSQSSISKYNTDNWSVAKLKRKIRDDDATKKRNKARIKELEVIYEETARYNSDAANKIEDNKTAFKKVCQYDVAYVFLSHY